MELPRLQYITHPLENFDDLSWVHRLHENGVRWIQLRIKEEDVVKRFPDRHYRAYFHEIADRMRVVTSASKMILTINDAADVALFSKSDGLHIGQEDDLNEVDFAVFGSTHLLGGTANSIAEFMHFENVPLSYLGVGPFAQTTTKDTSKPVLGIEGYVEFLRQLQGRERFIPVFAIGGITQKDVAPLLDNGVYGIAVSGAMFHSGHDPETIRSFTKVLEAYEFTTGR